MTATIMPLPELDLELLASVDHEELSSLLFVNRQLANYFDDALWYRRIEKEIGRPLGRLTLVPVRLAYAMIHAFMQRVNRLYDCAWVIWRDDPVLFEFVDQMLEREDEVVARIHLHLASFLYGPFSIRALIDLKAPWFVYIVKTWGYSIYGDYQSYDEWFEDQLHGWRTRYSSTEALRDAWCMGYEFLFRWLIDRGADPINAAMPHGECDEDPLQERYFAFLRKLEIEKHPAAKDALSKLLVRSLRSSDELTIYQDLLLKYGANPAYNDYWISPRTIETAKFFLNLNGEKHLRAREFAMFRNAVADDNIPLFRWLYEKYSSIINLNAADGFAIRTAVRNRSYEMVSLLVNWGVDLSVKNYSPILYAVSKGQKDIVKVLLPRLPMSYHSIVRPLTIAVNLGNVKTVKLFLNHQGVEKQLFALGSIPKLIRTASRSHQLSLVYLFDAMQRRYKDMMDTIKDS